MSERAWTSTGGGYRFGFNGMEKDDEVSGEGNSLDFGARVYDSRLGRWLSVDPKTIAYPNLTPYNYVANNPIFYIDPDGQKIVKPKNKEDRKLYRSQIKFMKKSDIFKKAYNEVKRSSKVIEIRFTNDPSKNGDYCTSSKCVE